MTTNPGATPSHFFTLRIWRDELGDGQAEWRGKVLHVVSGDARYFRDWQMLLAFLTSQLQDHSADPHPSASDVAQPHIS